MMSEAKGSAEDTLASDRPDGRRSVETAADFFKRRGEGGSRERLLEFLQRVPNRPPDPGDEIA